jgi:hypothetical protein
MGHHEYRPLANMVEVGGVRRPLFISETGAEGSARPAWLHYVAMSSGGAKPGTPRFQASAYPITYPGWDNSRHCQVGLLSTVGSDGATSTSRSRGAATATGDLRPR